MTKTLDDFMDTFSDEERAKIKARAKVFIEEEYSLHSLRKAHDLTQDAWRNCLASSKKMSPA